MDFFEKLEQNPYANLQWNIPEQKQGTVNIVGGNAGNFRAEVKIAEFLGAKYPVENVRLVLPDALKTKLPEMPNFKFLSSTESGSFSKRDELEVEMKNADFNILMGDLSKNAITGRAIADACENTKKPLVITRDGVDVVAENMTNLLLMNEKLMFFASIAQLVKLFRAVYYPKMLLMSQSLVQVAETLHKFTLSYPTKMITLHDGQVVLAENGMVKALPLENTHYSPFLFWNGEPVAKVVALNLCNPDNFIPASVCGLLS